MQLDGEIKPGLSSPVSLPAALATLAASGPGGKIPCFGTPRLELGTACKPQSLNLKPATIMFLKNNLFFVLFKTK